MARARARADAFKDTFTESDGTTTMLVDRSDNVAATAEAMLTVPLIVAPVLGLEQLDNVKKVTFSYDTETWDSSGQKVRSTWGVLGLEHVSDTHLDFHLAGGRELRVRNGDTSLLVGGQEYDVCPLDVSCSSFQVRGAGEADELVEKARAPPPRAPAHICM